MIKLKIAIIGSGYMAREHARAFKSLSNVKLVGVCGRSRERAEVFSKTYNMPLYESISAMYEDTKPDAVIIAVNELSTKDVCFDAFKYPWLCFVEKPVGINFVQAEEIMAASKVNSTRVYVALNRRSYASTRQAKALLIKLNGPRLISVLDQQDLISARISGQPEEVLFNYMYANSLHLIDYLNYFGRGEVISVEMAKKWDPENPGYVIATVRYSSGDIGVYQAVWNAPGPWSVTVTIPEMRLEMRPLESLKIQRLGERKLTSIDLDEIDLKFKPGLMYQAQEIVNLLEGLPTSLATLKEATRSMLLCSHIYGV